VRNGKMNNKKALEFSITFFVILAVGLVMIILSFMFFQRGLEQSERIASEIDQNTRLEIEKVLTESGERFIIPMYEVELRKGDSYSFGAGIKNVLDPTVFKLDVKFKKAETFAGEYLEAIDGDEFLFEDYGSYILDENEKTIQQVQLRIPKNVKENVNYYFEVTVSCVLDTELCDPYGYPQEIVVKVV
jgi:hypothetical protein